MKAKSTERVPAENEIANAIRYYADKDGYPEHQRQANARIQWAAKLQDAGNLVLAGTVVSQMLSIKSGEFNIEAAVAGLVIFAIAYIYAAIFMNIKGGEKV